MEILKVKKSCKGDGPSPKVKGLSKLWRNLEGIGLKFKKLLKQEVLHKLEATPKNTSWVWTKMVRTSNLTHKILNKFLMMIRVFQSHSLIILRVTQRRIKVRKEIIPNQRQRVSMNSVNGNRKIHNRLPWIRTVLVKISAYLHNNSLDNISENFLTIVFLWYLFTKTENFSKMEAILSNCVKKRSL